MPPHFRTILKSVLVVAVVGVVGGLIILSRWFHEQDAQRVRLMRRLDAHMKAHSSRSEMHRFMGEPRRSEAIGNTIVDYYTLDANRVDTWSVLLTFSNTSLRLSDIQVDGRNWDEFVRETGHLDDK